MPDVVINVKVEGAEAAENKLRGLGDATDEVGKTSKKTTRSTDNLGSSVLGFAGGAANAASGALGMVDSFRELDKKQLAATRSSKKLSEADEKVAKTYKALQEGLKGQAQGYELVIPQGKEFVRMMSATEVQVRNSNGEVSTIPAKYKKAGKATKDITQLQDDYNDALRDRAIAEENTRLKTEDFTVAQQRQGFVIAENGLQIGSGVATMGAFAKSMKESFDNAGPLTQRMGKLAGAAGLVGGAVLFAVEAAKMKTDITLADPKNVAQLKKEEKQMKKTSAAAISFQQIGDELGKTFGGAGEAIGKFGKDVQVAGAATIDWVIDSVWPPIQNIIDSMPPELKKFAADAQATITWIVEQIWSFFSVTVPDALKSFAADAQATINWVVEQVWNFFTVTVPDTLKQFAADAQATITWIVEQVWGFFTVTVPETLKKFASDAQAAITWVVEQVWSFFTVTVPDALKQFAADAIAAITWVVEQVWSFFTVTVPETLKRFASDAIAAITWVVQQVWSFFTVTVPETLKRFASDAVAAITWVVQQVWSFFTVTVPDALKSLAAQATAAITWVVQQVWSFFTVTVPEALKAIAVAALATVTWGIKQIWSTFTVTVPKGLKEIQVAALATVKWAVKNIFPPGSTADKVTSGQAGGRRRGGTDIVTSPTTLRIGEGFHPELVTVIPLTGPHSPPGAAESVGMRRGGQIVSGPLHAATGGQFLASGTTEVARRAEVDRKKIELAQQQAVTRATHVWNQQISFARAEEKKTRKKLEESKKALAGVLKAGDSAGASKVQGEINKLNKELQKQTQILSSLNSNKPKDPGPVPSPQITVKATSAAKGFGPAMVSKPTLFMAGEGGPELVNVTPLKNGTHGGGGSPSDIGELIGLLKGYIGMQRRQGLNANLFLDGQRLASSVQKYSGTKSYGDR